jgi:hypothetical protein
MRLWDDVGTWLPAVGELTTNRHKGVSMASQNVEIAKKAYEAFAAGDLETVLSTFDDNVEFVIPALQS